MADRTPPVFAPNWLHEEEPPEVVWVADCRLDGRTVARWFPTEDAAIEWLDGLPAEATNATLRGRARRQPGSSEWWHFDREADDA